MPILSSRAQVAIKQEAVAGTAEALAAADVRLTTELATFAAEPEIRQRQAMTGSLSKRGHVIGARLARIAFKMFLRGTTGAPVDPTNLPDFVVPMRGCGARATVSGTVPNEQTSIVPTSVDISDETSGAYCTVAIYRDGKRHMIHGAVGNCTVSFEVGVPVLAEFEFTGVYNTPTDVALLTPTYPTIVEPPFLAAALTVLGFTTARIRKLTLNFGNTIVMRPSPNAGTGFYTAQISDRNPTGTLDPEESLAATKDYWTEWFAGALGSIATGTFPSGGANYNQLSLTIPNAQYSRVSHEDREGIASSPIEFAARANSDAGEDEWNLIQT